MRRCHDQPKRVSRRAATLCRCDEVLRSIPLRCYKPSRANCVLFPRISTMFEHAKIVSPQSIKRYFNYSGMRSYKDRKKKGVELFKKLCRENKQMPLFEKVLRGRNKIDDVADAALIGYYIFAENKVAEKKDHGDASQWVTDNVWVVSPS